MRAFFPMLVIVSAFNFIYVATEVDVFEVIEPIVVQPPVKKEQSTTKSVDGRRRKRSVTSTDQENIVDKLNSLRSSVGASNMNYVLYSSSLQDDATNWTSRCNNDVVIYTHTPSSNVYALGGLGSGRPNPALALETFFSDTRFHSALSSAYLHYVGADYSYCSQALDNGTYEVDVYLALYLFSYSSYVNVSQQQYTLGEQCTTCLSGSYWCYQGLCKDDCSSSDSNCYCNSYCLNCANTSETTCRCQCLQGWTGSSCETRSGISVASPICSTTPRSSRTSTTQSTTITTRSTTKSTTTTTRSTTKTTTINARSTTEGTTITTRSTTESTTIDIPSATKNTRINTSWVTQSNSGSIKKLSAIGNTPLMLAIYATVALFL